MRLPNWPVTVRLSIAAAAFGASWLFDEGVRVASAETALPDRGATLASDRFPEETPGPGIVLKAQGTWLDPPPQASEPPAQAPMPPWYPPYDTRAHYDRDGSWFGYGPQRDVDSRRQGSWLDAFCPLPQHRHAWPGRRDDSWQIQPPFGQGYPTPFMDQQPFGYREPWGR